MTKRLKIIGNLFIVLLFCVSFLSGFFINAEIYSTNSNKQEPVKLSAPSPNLLWNYTCIEGIRSVSLSADGSLITASTYSGDSRVYLFDNIGSTSKTPLWNYTAPNSVYSADISADGNYIAGVDDSQRIFLLNSSITDPKQPVWVFSPTGSLMNDAMISAEW